MSTRSLLFPKIAFVQQSKMYDPIPDQNSLKNEVIVKGHTYVAYI